MENNQKIYVGEYSFNQKMYNIETLDRITTLNLELISQGVNCDYIPICYGSSIQEVSEKLDIIKERIQRP